MRKRTDRTSRNRPGPALNLTPRALFSTLALLAALLVLVLPASGCSYAEDKVEQDGDEPVLRSYKVDPQYGDELKSILTDMLNRGGDTPSMGSVRVPRDGLVVVTAPASIHAGIEEIISALGSTSPTPPPTIRITYWAVQGKVAAEMAWPASLDQLQEALEAIAQVDGPLTFTLQEKIALNSLSGSHARTDGPYFGIQQKATSRNGVVHADLNIEKGPAMRVRTSVRLEPGQLMVLEQAGFTTMVQGAPEMARSSTYIILQAEVVSSDGR